MSGGSLDYAFSQVEDLADDLKRRATRAEHRAFAAHLRKVAKALHDIEWMLSGDTGEGSEISSIMDCVTPTDVMDTAREAIEAAMAEGRRLVEEMKVPK